MSDIKTNGSGGYEKTDVKFKPVFYSGLALFLLIILAMVLMFFLFGYFRSAREANMEPVSPLASERQLPEEPRLQVHPNLDWQKFKARQDSVINSYGWISKEAGVVRIPVADAMKIMLERGFPVRPEQPEPVK